MRIYLALVILFFSLSCSRQYGDDCSGGACCCSDEIVKTVVPSDSNYLPFKVRQQLLFTSGADSIVYNGYTNGIIKTPVLVEVGTKSEVVPCGIDLCKYFVNNISENLVYYSTDNNEIFRIAMQTLIKKKFVNGYSYDYTVSEVSFIDILGTRFFLNATNFNPNDSNNIQYYTVLNINSKSYSNVFKIERDSSMLVNTQPFKCYYSRSEDGLIGFELKNGIEYFRVD